MSLEDNDEPAHPRSLSEIEFPQPSIAINAPRDHHILWSKWSKIVISDSLLAGAKRVPGLKLDIPRQLAAIPRSRRYQLTEQGYRLSLVYLKLFEKLYAPLAAAVIHPCSSDRLLSLHRTAALDQRYLAVKQSLDNLVREIGLEAAA